VTVTVDPCGLSCLILDGPRGCSATTANSVLVQGRESTPFAVTNMLAGLPLADLSSLLALFTFPTSGPVVERSLGPTVAGAGCACADPKAESCVSRSLSLLGQEPTYAALGSFARLCSSGCHSGGPNPLLRDFYRDRPPAGALRMLKRDHRGCHQAARTRASAMPTALS